jgi:hypothetical protein
VAGRRQAAGLQSAANELMAPEFDDSDEASSQADTGGEGQGSGQDECDESRRGQQQGQGQGGGAACSQALTFRGPTPAAGLLAARRCPLRCRGGAHRLAQPPALPRWLEACWRWRCACSNRTCRHLAAHRHQAAAQPPAGLGRRGRFGGDAGGPGDQAVPHGWRLARSGALPAAAAPGPAAAAAAAATPATAPAAGAGAAPSAAAASAGAANGARVRQQAQGAPAAAPWRRQPGV